MTASTYPLSNIKKQYDLSVQPIVASKCDVSYEVITEGIVRGSTSRNNTTSEISNGGIKYGILTGANKKTGTN
jgi:hypothetical protein